MFIEQADCGRHVLYNQTV